MNVPEARNVLLTNDGTDLTSQVKIALLNLGYSVTILNFSGIANPIDDQSINLPESSDEGVKVLMETFRSNEPKINCFIHLHPHFENKNNGILSIEKEVIKSVYFLAKYLHQELNEFDGTERACFMAVTNTDGQFGLKNQRQSSFLSGGLNGLVKSLNLEWPKVFCRSVDLQNDLSVLQKSEQILKELHDPDATIVEVGFSNLGRNTLIAKSNNNDKQFPTQTSLNSDLVFLVSGGARGITATCMIEMAKACHCKFILLGRSNIEDFVLPSYANDIQDNGELKKLILEDLKSKGDAPTLTNVKKIYNQIIAKKEIEQTIASIEANGGNAVYLSADVTDLNSFKDQVRKASSKLGKITGIIHGAGRLADKYIQNKSDSDFENVFSVKVNGLLNLLESVDPKDLKHLMLFSSVAGFYGNIGQTDYALANEVLNKSAYYFKQSFPDLKVSSINWGAWDGGMVSESLKSQFEEAGVKLVNSMGGANMLVNEFNILNDDQAQVIIGGTLPRAKSHIGPLSEFRIQRKLLAEVNPFLQHHIIHDNPVLPVVNAIGWMAHGCAQLYPDFVVHKVEETRLFKGIVFDGNENVDYILELKERSKSNDEIIFESTILSHGKKLPTYHFKAQITLVNKSKKLIIPIFKPIPERNINPIPGYELYQNGSLFHDHHFRGIQEILRLSDTEIFLSCKAPKVALMDQGQFPIRDINTFFADIQYQGMVVWVQKYFDGAKSLPLQTNSAIIYRPIPFEQKLFVLIKIIEKSEVSMSANCTVFDDLGNIYMETKGAKVTISKQLVW